ncbi:hypothetical protein [Pumilibacter intestinalis]|uniref:hypothetical protein n=1 Tax=Pumilibacter intestinalis TaxID=2941511 RepID=UPI00203D9C65|nr:hypothetical protein [Pumilibacter intestinalis]
MLANNTKFKESKLWTIREIIVIDAENLMFFIPKAISDIINPKWGGVVKSAE